MTQFKIGEKYKTRCGYDVEIYAIKEGQRECFLGALYQGDAWIPVSWYRDGKHIFNRIMHDWDIVPPAPEKVKVCLCVYKNKNNGTIMSSSFTVKNEYMKLKMGEDWTLISGPTFIEMELNDDSGE